MHHSTKYLQDIQQNVAWALEEDIRSSDISAQIIPDNYNSTAQLITRETGIMCGIAWFNEVFNQLDPITQINWLVKDGDHLSANQILCEVSGNSRILLTGERTALNFVQTLSGTANATHKMAQLIAHTNAKLLDTRKTIPGLRSAQKYAVVCGGGNNHRLDLHDAYLLKENHIAALGSITQCIKYARQLEPNKKLEIEVTNFSQLKEAMKEKADVIMLDNFELADIKKAVEYNSKQVKLEVSGNINATNIVQFAETGVDYISLGAITKNCHALDLSFLFIQ